MNFFACYERNFARKWCLTVYHDSKPPKSVNSTDPERSTYWEVPNTEQFVSCGEPIFGAIRKAFPAPVDPDEVEHVEASEVAVSLQS